MNQAAKDAKREYQDPVTPDFRKHVNIWADLERLRPKGDCVLIRVMPEPEMHANLIWIPERVRGKGDNSPRVGEVVAIGLGDRFFAWVCDHCLQTRRSTFHSPRVCPHCGNSDATLGGIGHHPMHVRLGDRVYFWRVFANQAIIDNEVFQFVREEQHILAVLDKEGEDAHTN